MTVAYHTESFGAFALWLRVRPRAPANRGSAPSEPGKDAMHPEPTTIAVSGAEFGWGSSGKLNAVLSALRNRSRTPLRFIGLASGLGRPLLADQPVGPWHDLPATVPELRAGVQEITRTQHVQAALVVLDGPVATALENAGVPTVFVDSLPFMWSEGDRDALPLNATVYCAQQCLDLPPECRDILASVPTLRWVEAVIDTPPPVPPARSAAARPYRTALVSLGGLRSPYLADWTSYPRVVVPAALAALAAHGVARAHLAGNLPAALTDRLTHHAPASLELTTGALSPSSFLSELAHCDVLLTSPGLTTLLEAGRLQVPTVCLPPQNLSQIFNGRFHAQAAGADVRATWPDDVFSEGEALTLRAKGEDHALALIYDGIGAAASDGGQTAATLRDRILDALQRSAAVTDWGALTTAVGTGGAAQVADALLEILPA